MPCPAEVLGGSECGQVSKYVDPGDSLGCGRKAFPKEAGRSCRSSSAASNIQAAQTKSTRAVDGRIHRYCATAEHHTPELREHTAERGCGGGSSVVQPLALKKSALHRTRKAHIYDAQSWAE